MNLSDITYKKITISLSKDRFFGIRYKFEFNGETFERGYRNKTQAIAWAKHHIDRLIRNKILVPMKEGYYVCYNSQVYFFEDEHEQSKFANNNENTTKFEIRGSKQ